MSSPSVKPNKTTSQTSGNRRNGSAGASRESAQSTCGTEVAHKHGSVTTTDDAGASSSGVKVNGKSTDTVKTMPYSMARYLAGEERHEMVAQGIVSARK
ncbi:hypothetical protein LTR08_006550 [Meristemomyces frigidus]|nr:hypothetical protein LTR08_006550 [Meristemomyces frigidus]